MHDLTIPIAVLDDEGAVQPNVIFHRPVDRLHSRTVEYPFAASRLNPMGTILDIGTAHADNAWIRWLASLPSTVVGVDYDVRASDTLGPPLYRADVRHLPFADDTIDTIFAVSVIEHIGLSKPHSVSFLPPPTERGDLRALREIARVLKPDGRLIMTVPFGANQHHVRNNAARCYTDTDLEDFERILEPVVLDYYEYQFRTSRRYFNESPLPRRNRLFQSMLRSLRYRRRRHSTTATPANKPATIEAVRLPKLPGRVTWRRVPIGAKRALNQTHIDGVLCSEWRKST